MSRKSINTHENTTCHFAVPHHFFGVGNFLMLYLIIKFVVQTLICYYWKLSIYLIVDSNLRLNQCICPSIFIHTFLFTKKLWLFLLNLFIFLPFYCKKLRIIYLYSSFFLCVFKVFMKYVVKFLILDEAFFNYIVVSPKKCELSVAIVGVVGLSFSTFI